MENFCVQHQVQTPRNLFKTLLKISQKYDIENHLKIVPFSGKTLGTFPTYELAQMSFSCLKSY